MDKLYITQRCSTSQNNGFNAMEENDEFATFLFERT